MKYKSTGALHIHSKYSDGTGSIEKIARDAKKAGLSWIIITDHNCLMGLKRNKEGWYDGVAVLIGEEITPGDSNHYLALNINQEISSELAPEDFINEVKKQDGVGFVAHPDESLNRKNDFKPLRWKNFDIKDFGGIEIWNYMSDWVDNYNPGLKIHAYLRKNHILKGPTKKVLQWWDDLNNSTAQIIPAVGGVDEHAMRYKCFGLKFTIFHYFDTFKALTNNLYLDEELSKDFLYAKKQIYDALKYGKNSIINNYWNKKGEFKFCIENKNICVFPGDQIGFEDNLKAVVNISRKATIRLIYNGQLIQENMSDSVIYENIKPGKYRVEVYYKNHPWIFTNPILIA